MVDPSNVAAVFADEVKMRELVRNVEKISQSVELLAVKLGGLEKSVPATLEAAKDGADDLNDSLQDTTDRLKDMADLAEESFTKWQKWGQSLTGIFQGVGGAINKAGEIMRTLNANPQNAIMTAVGQVPYAGPLLQIALESQFREDRFKTAGRQAALSFQRNEGLDPTKVKEMGTTLGADMKRIEEGFLGKREEIQAVWAAFAEGGLKSADMAKKAGFEIAGFGETISQVALGTDKAFGQVAGTTADLSNQIRQNTNASLAESVSLVKDLGLASHGTGQNMQSFINTILQTTSALRVQGGDALDLANTYFKLQETIKGAMTSTTSGQRVSALTGAAMGGLSQFAQGMPMGLKALVGQDIAKSMGITTSDIGGLRAMETGFQFFGEKSLKQEDFSKKVAETAFARLRSEGVKPGDDMFMALTSMGMPALLAEVLNRPEVQGNLGGKGAEKAAKEYEDKLKQVKDLQPLNSGDFEKVMDDIKKLMMSIGQMTLGVLGVIAQTLISSARFTFDSTYTRADALQDITGRADKVAAEGKHMAGLASQFGGDIAEALDVGNFMRTGSKQGQASLSEQLLQQGALTALAPGAAIPLGLLNLYRNNTGSGSDSDSGPRRSPDPSFGGRGSGGASLEGLQSQVETDRGYLKVYLNPRVEFEPNRSISRGDTPELSR